MFSEAFVSAIRVSKSNESWHSFLLGPFFIQTKQLLVKLDVELQVALLFLDHFPPVEVVEMAFNLRREGFQRRILFNSVGMSQQWIVYLQDSHFVGVATVKHQNTYGCANGLVLLVA